MAWKRLQSLLFVVFVDKLINDSYSARLEINMAVMVAVGGSLATVCCYC